MRRPGNSHGGFHVRDPFDHTPTLRQRSRPLVGALMVLGGALLTLLSLFAGNLGLRVPVLTAFPALTLIAGLWLLLVGHARRR